MSSARRENEIQYAVQDAMGMSRVFAIFSRVFIVKINKDETRLWLKTDLDALSLRDFASLIPITETTRLYRL